MKFQFRGRVYLAERLDSGAPGPFFFVGCADALSFALSVETFTHISKCDSNDSVDFRGTKAQNAEASLTLTEFTKENLELALRGTAVPQSTAGAVVDETLPTGILAGMSVILGGASPHTNVSSVVVEGNAIALVEGTDYTVNLDTGTVSFITTPTAPVTASYNYQDMAYVSMFTAGAKEYWLRFDNVNKAAGDEPGVVDLYRMLFDPAAALDMLSDELATFDLTGAVLVDDKKLSTGDLGQFGRITYPSA